MKRHLVLRCFGCGYNLWGTTIAGLLGYTPPKKKRTEPAFIAKTNGTGHGRGWRFDHAIPTYAEVAVAAGPEGV